jgi:protoheme IX farnesyltransferase
MWGLGQNRVIGVMSDYIALAKPTITSLAVFMAASGLFLGGFAELRLALAALLGIALVVGSANTLNMFIERDTDRLMTRTAERPLPAGRMQPGHALWVGAISGVSGLLLLGVMVNALTMWIGAASLCVYVLLYTPLKRVTTWALLIGAFPGAAPPLMGWTAATGELGGPGLALFSIVLIWQMPHFLAITMYRKEEYQRAGIKVVANVKGEHVAKLQILAYSTALLPCSLALGFTGAAGWIYVAVASALGLWFWWEALKGLRAEPEPRWARSLFFGSLLYLPLLMAGLGLDRILS